MTQPPPSGQPGGYYQPQQPQQPYPQQHPQAGGQYQGGQYQPQPPDAQPYGNPPQYGTPPPQGNPPGYGNPPPPGGGYQVPGGVNPQPRKSGKGKLFAIFGGIGGVVLLGIGILVIRLVIGAVSGDINLSRQVPDVGECITQASLFGSETEVVGCDSADAAWQVLGNAGEYTEGEFDTAVQDAAGQEELCGAYPESGYILWIGEITDDQSGSGEVVCLMEVS